MSIRHRIRQTAPWLATLLLVSAAAGPLSAQSLLASRGLGLPVEPLDARAAGLGGTSLGLLGSYLSFSDPAASAGLPAPAFVLSVATDQFEADYGGRRAEGGTARFPLLLGGFNVSSRLGVTAGYGSYLDQHWAVEQPDTLFFEGDTLPALDRFLSDGGVARLRLGAGYAVTSNLSVGAGVDLYTGSVVRTTGRIFDGQAAPECCTAEWDYGGTGFVASALWSSSDAVRVSAAVEMGGTLEAEPDATDEAVTVPAREFELPVSASLGGSARVTANTLVALSARWSEWSTTDPFVAGVGGAQDVLSATGGVEWDGLAVGGRPVPLRVGARFADLPFRWSEDWLEERALTAGAGIILAGGAAVGDLAVERGWRGSAEAGFDESYWRFAFSLRVVGR